MEFPVNMKKKLRVLETKKDRISILPDDLIHKICSFLEAKEAIQTSVLSKRWKCVWTTLPFLNIGEYEHCKPSKTSNFISHVMKDRHIQSHILNLKLCVSKIGLTNIGILKEFLGYAISHNLEDLNLELKYKHRPYKLSTLSSKLLKKLTLRIKLEDFKLGSDCWDLPALTVLHLKCPVLDGNHKLPNSCLTSLPALRTLCLDDWDLSISSFSFNLPHLTTLRLSGCSGLTKKVWKFPALLSLQLDDVAIPESAIAKIVSLQNLTLIAVNIKGCCEGAIYFPQLLNLHIRMRLSDSYRCINLESDSYRRIDLRINLSTPKLCNFTSVGIFLISLKAPQLENVNLKLEGWFGNMEWIYREEYYRDFWRMLPELGLGNIKNLTFDLESVKALSAISNEHRGEPSPFHNLECVRLPHESSLSKALKGYLLGGSSRGTIVTTLPRNTIPHTEEHVVEDSDRVKDVDAPVREMGKDPVSSSAGNRDFGLWRGHKMTIHHTKKQVVEDSAVNANRIRDVDAPVGEMGKDPVSSSAGNRDLGLWRGHKVNSEFVCLLDRIMLKYPETFENFTKNNKKLCTMNLNMFCTSVNDFTKISMTEVDSEMLVEYRDAFAYLQNKGFNLSWVVSRLDYIEHLRFSNPLIPELNAIDCRINDDKSKLQELQACVDDAKVKLQNLEARVDDAKTKLQDAQALRAEKLTEIEKAFGSMGTNLAIGFIGDDLLSSP